nr:class I SAM-dependent methyltransferase [Ardenticatena sp.]
MSRVIARQPFSTPEGIEDYVQFEQRFLTLSRCLFVEIALVECNRVPGYVLDVGCGTGALLAYLRERCPNAKLFGIDPSSHMLTYARRILADNALLMQSPIESFTTTQAFDLIVSYSTLRLWDNPQYGLQKIYEMLAPGGIAYILDLHRDLPLDTVQEIFLHLPEQSQRTFFEQQLSAAYTLSELRYILQSSKIPGIEMRQGGLAGYPPFSAESITLIQQNPRIAEYVFRLGSEGFRTPKASEAVVHIFIRKE